MINNVVLVGRLTRAVDLRYTSNGTAYASFTVAVERNFKNQNGEKETDFINCAMWRKAAENFANFTHKGSLVGIEGRIQTRNYENQQGQKVYVTEVLAENFSLLEARNATNQLEGSREGFEGGYVNTFNGNKNANTVGNFANNDLFTANGETFNVTDEDLPF
jgi:single-strand DNA-binding protein